MKVTDEHIRQACISYLLEQESKSKLLKEQITLQEHSKFIEWIKNLDYKTATHLVLCELDETRAQKIMRIVKQVAAIGGLAILAGRGLRLRNNALTAIHGNRVAIALGVILGTVIFSAAVNAMADHFTSACYKSCLARKITGKEFEFCQAKCEIEGNQRTLAMLQSEKTKCDKTKYPTPCKEKINKSIEELQLKNSKIKKKIPRLAIAEKNSKIKKKIPRLAIAAKKERERELKARK